MMSRRRAAVLALASIVLLGAQTTADGTDVQVVDASNYPLARIIFTPPVEVRGTELAPEDVMLTQDGEPVEFILRALEAEPVEAVLVIDTSGSMRGTPLAAAKEAAIGFVNQMPSGSDIAVVAFGDDVAVVAELGTPIEDLANAINSLQATGETSLHDAIIAAVTIADAGPRARQFIITLSDGGDTASIAPLSEAVAAVQTIDVGFFAIALESADFDLTALEEMAAAADGVVAAASNSAALADVYSGIAVELASQYSLVFEPLRGGTTTFEVTVDTPSGPSTDRFTVDLPPLGSSGGRPDSTSTTVSPVPSTIVDSAREITPPPRRVVGEPGPLQRPWALGVGIGALFMVLLLAFALALKPQQTRERRRGVLDPDQTGFGERHSRLSRIRTFIQDRFERVAARRESSGAGAVESSLDAAGVALRPGEFAVMSTVGAVLGFLIGTATGNFGLAIVLAVAAIVGPRLWLKRATTRRRAEFADQLEGTLQLIAGSLRAGYGIGQSINTVATESADPTQSEFSRVVVETRLGRDLDDALDALAERMDNQDLRWVTDAIEIQRGVGGDLAEVLDKVSSTIRDRNQIRRQVQALTAEGRLSAVILIALPFGLAGFISITNPGYLSDLTTTFAGRLMLLAGAVLMTVGVAWIRRLIRIEF